MSATGRRFRRGQQGAVAMLMVLLLLVVMAAAALGASGNVLRELSVGGDALLGSLAADAAEAGVAWFLAGAWCQGPAPPWGPDGRLVVPGEAGALAAMPGFRQGFELRGLDLGPCPSAGLTDPGGPQRLWQVTVRGWSRPAGAEDGSAFQNWCELLVRVPAAAGPPAEPLDPGPGVELLAYRTFF